MLTNNLDILRSALKEGYAIPSYNINNLEWTKYILEESNKFNKAVILSISESTIFYFGGYFVVSNLVKTLIKELNIRVPVILNLDHAKSFESCKKAIDSGFTSVMIDASNKSFEENVEITKKVVKYAHGHNCMVEAELGSIDNRVYTNIDECLDFISLTDIDILAPFVGNYHGVYKNEVNIDFDLLSAICRKVKIPVALHGASGLDDNKLKTAVFCGVTKVNINTDLQIAWNEAVRKYLNTNKDVYDPKKIIASGEKSIKNIIEKKNKALFKEFF